MSRLPRQLEDLSRMLTYMLGHRPDEFGLVLDAEGWIPIKPLLQALAREPGFRQARREHLEELAALLTPRRFEIEGDRIRSLDPAPRPHRRPAATLPSLLYLAIPPKAHLLVWEQGAKPPAGQELLLTAFPETALKLGRRRAPSPILVTVQAQAAARAGTTFQAYGEELYLAPSLPREFLQLPPPPKAPAKPKPPPAAKAPPAPGSVILDLPQILMETHKPRRLKDEPAWKSGARALRKKRRGE